MWRLSCKKCGFKGEAEKYYPYCPRCGSPLSIEGKAPSFKPMLGEGNTPIVEERLGDNRIYYKLEYLNPTGSFKDRGVSYNIMLASSLGYRCVVEDSSGNTGISVAAYSSRMGMESKVIIPASAPKGKKSLLRALGAEVIESETRDKGTKIAEELSKHCFYVSHARNPFFIEGIKSVAKELKDLYIRGVVVPSSSFSLFLGTYYGFKEMGKKVMMFAVQGKETASLKKYIKPVYESKGPTSRLADGLALSSSPRAEEAFHAIKESNGGLVVLDDGDIKKGLKLLWRKGYMVEPTSATSLVALQKLDELGYDVDGFVLMLTGNGLKFYDMIEAMLS